MTAYVDPSQQTPLFTAQQVTCAYPISDSYAACPRYLYYSLLVSCILVRWHPWLSDAFLGAAATYAGVAAIESFILLAGYPRQRSLEWISIPYVDRASVKGNTTFQALPNLVTNSTTLPVWPAVYEFDIDAILAIVVTGYLFMLPAHCWSTRIRGRRARHLLMGLWNILMLCGTICGLILWFKLGNVPWQYRFCYPAYPDLDSITNDGWVSSLWRGDWNSTIWNTFADPAAYNNLIENCMYPCFNTSQVLRRSQSIVANLHTNKSPRTNSQLTDSQATHQEHLIYFMYAAICLSALTAVVTLLVVATGMDRHFTILPLHQPLRVWTERSRIKSELVHDLRNLMPKPRQKKLSKTEKEAASISITEQQEADIRRRKSLFRLLGNLFAFSLMFCVVILIPATWIAFIVWIEWWIHRDIVSQETPRQVGQWAPAVSVGLVAVSALVMRFKRKLASREEIEVEMDELKSRLRELESLKETKA